MIYRYEDLLVPLFLQNMTDDGYFEKVGFWSNVLFNFAFNAGYQLRDVIWIFYMTENEGWYDFKKQEREDQLELEFIERQRIANQKLTDDYENSAAYKLYEAAL